MTTSFRHIIHTLSALLMLLIAMGCTSTQSDKLIEKNDWDSIVASKQLRIITLYSSTSYFIYRSQEMGYEYELAKEFANSHGLNLTVVLANNINHLRQMLLRGEGDIIAYNIVKDNQMEDSIIYCGQEQISHQVLIQRRTSPLITDVTELVNKEVTIIPNTKYESRLKNLNNELGGGIQIRELDHDSVTIEELISMVADKKIDYTVADDNLARLGRTYHNNLNISLALSFDQRSSWAVRKQSSVLADTLNRWFVDNVKSPTLQNINKRYFEMSKLPFGGAKGAIKSIEKGVISAYDPFFKTYAKKINWDWRLLAALAFTESNFNASISSWAGAVGLMQLMPKTAATVGCSAEELQQPEANIKASVRYIQNLDRAFLFIEEPSERVKFVLASYNSGPGHIYDAIALARKYGRNPSVWDKHVDHYVLEKQKPEFYNDPVCKNGYFRGSETYNFVRTVLGTYHYYKQKIKQ